MIFVRGWAWVWVLGGAAPIPGWRVLALGGSRSPGVGAGRQWGALGRQGRAELGSLKERPGPGPAEADSGGIPGGAVAICLRGAWVIWQH